MRQAFGLIQALIVIVLVSGLLIIAMKYAQITTKQTADLYLKERAQLFMDEAVEMTLLAISGYDRSTQNDCLKNINFISEDKRFDANVSIKKYYLFEGNDNNRTTLSNCDRVQAIVTEDSHGMVDLEIVVKTNATHPKNQDKKIRIIRRTLQRP
ncbi:MAG: hypothetical protein IBX44_07105 [Sulfurospirillum sp.]|nr:hypothetical protein [Sulfurospirillum sp.]